MVLLMKKLLSILVLSLSLSGNAYAEIKYLLCKDTDLYPKKNIYGIKNDFFSEKGQVVAISYRENITKIWGENSSNIFQFTLINDGSEYKFEYPKNVFDASTPRWLNFKEKIFLDINNLSGADFYYFEWGYINKVTLKGQVIYNIRKDENTKYIRTKDRFIVHFQCEPVKPKI